MSTPWSDEQRAQLHDGYLAAEGPSPEAVAVGIEVAHTWAGQDRLDPDRPTLPQVVAQVVDRRIAGRRATDGADRDALLDLLAAVDELLRQPADGTPRGGLAAARDRARRHVDRTGGGR